MSERLPSWPFEDPKNLASYTVDDVLSGAKPILHVCHDVSDGCWQFLTGDDVDLTKARLVCLAHAVEIDSALLELSDLPLGWCAEREGPGRPWSRVASFPVEWDELVRQAYAYTEEQQERLKADFSLLDWERFDYDQEQASLVFSSGGVTRLSFHIQIVGSTATRSGTWLWSWDNPSILEQAAECMHLLQRFGTQHGFGRLTKSTWPAEEVDGWEMTAVACLLLGGEGAYRVPDDNGALFMVLSSPRIESPV